MGRQMVDWSGRKYGRLTVVDQKMRYAKNGKALGYDLMICECTCGTVKEILKASLQGGRTRSCGCLNREVNKLPRRKLEYPDTPLGQLWRRLRYKLCPEWQDSYDLFAQEVGIPIRAEMFLCRLNNKEPYGPGNFEWRTPLKSQRVGHAINKLVKARGPEIAPPRRGRPLKYG